MGQAQTVLYSPWDQLPAPPPKSLQYPPGYFYEHTGKYLIKDAVRIMDNGLHLNIDNVIELEDTLAKQLLEVEKELSENPLIAKYLEQKYSEEIIAYKKERETKLRPFTYYVVPFTVKNVNHRSYFMDEYAKQQGWSSPEDKLPTGVGKWPINLIKKYAVSNKLLQMLLKDKLPANTPAAVTAMERLAKDKAAMYNEKFLAQINNPFVNYPKFNPASSKQKQELFAMLGIESGAISKDTGLPSWDRDQIEAVNKETTDDDVRHFTQCFIDYSFAAIIKNNFIEAFYNYSVDGRLYGSYRLFGAKSGRFTSSNPNMLNSPSTGSRFAKAVKRCFTAPKGKVILTADYQALEDRVIANLSGDTNKVSLFTEDLDGHSLSATYYYPEKVKALVGDIPDNKEASKVLKQLVDNGNKEAKEVRQMSKPVQFGLAYGAYPPKVAATIKIPLPQAEEIFEAYHNKLYPGITNYRENYVLPTAKELGEIHLGLGFCLKTDDAKRDIRTLANATCQFWSILTAITINKMHQLIDKENLANDVKVISTIYDSIYFEVTESPKIIKWVNDNLIAIMCKDFMEGQIVKNVAVSDIGYDWADMISITNNAPINEIKDVLKQLKQPPKK